MNLPQQPGRYIAKPVNYAVEASDKANSQSVSWTCQYDLLHFYDKAANEWVDVSADGFQITGWHYVIKKDGTPNETQIKQLKGAIGWDGLALSSLESEEWKQREVQLQVDNEQGNDGKWRLKANWIDARDADPVGGGGVKRSDASVIQSLDAKYGAQLRALRGPVPENQTGAAKRPAVPGAATNPLAAVQQLAWKSFNDKWTAHVAEFPEDAPLKDEKWKSAMNEYFGIGNDPKRATAEQWADFAKQIAEDYSPALGSFIPV